MAAKFLHDSLGVRSQDDILGSQYKPGDGHNSHSYPKTRRRLMKSRNLTPSRYSPETVLADLGGFGSGERPRQAVGAAEDRRGALPLESSLSPDEALVAVGAGHVQRGGVGGGGGGRCQGQGQARWRHGED